MAAVPTGPPPRLAPVYPQTDRDILSPLITKGDIVLATDAQIGLVSGFGMVTYDRCLCTGALILSSAEGLT